MGSVGGLGCSAESGSSMSCCCRDLIDWSFALLLTDSLVDWLFKSSPSFDMFAMYTALDDYLCIGGRPLPLLNEQKLVIPKGLLRRYKLC